MAADARVAYGLHSARRVPREEASFPDDGRARPSWGLRPPGSTPATPALEGRTLGTAGVAAGSAGKPPEVPDRERGVNRAGWPAPYRAPRRWSCSHGAAAACSCCCNLRGTSGSSAGSAARRARCATLRSSVSWMTSADYSDVRRLPQVVVSRRAMTPFAVGFRRPIVVLPERLIGAVSGEEMRDVLVHEVAHVRRRDHLIVLLQELARALYWPIVTVHGLIRELGQAREELCDNHVLRGRDALSYGETLLHLAELSWEARPLRTDGRNPALEG